jgi:hypothetical protein
MIAPVGGFRLLARLLNSRLLALGEAFRLFGRWPLLADSVAKVGFCERCLSAAQ